jgi:hypothetical protein
MIIPPTMLYAVLRYSLLSYDFPSVISDCLGGDNLTWLSADVPVATRETDQMTRWHRLFYNTCYAWQPLYKNFIRQFIAPLFGEPVYYQAIPTFRVHLQANKAVGEYHNDADYGHPPGELNFWVPLTVAHSSNSIHIVDGGVPRAIEAYPGDIIVFDAVQRRHGNEINTTGRTRVSMDFRCLPVRLYHDNLKRSVNTGVRFAPGEYYAAESVGELSYLALVQREYSSISFSRAWPLRRWSRRA